MDTAFGDYLIGIGQGGVYQGPMGQFTTWYFDNPGQSADGTYPTYVSGRQTFPDQGWYYDPMNLGDLFNETAGGATFYQPMDGGPAVIPGASDPSINTNPLSIGGNENLYQLMDENIVPYTIPPSIVGNEPPPSVPTSVPTSDIEAELADMWNSQFGDFADLPDLPPGGVAPVPPGGVAPVPTLPQSDGDPIIYGEGEIWESPLPPKGNLGIQPHKTTRTWASNSGTNLRGGIPDNRVKSVKNLNRTDSRFIRTLST
jgi:hypothetical protein